MKNDSTCSDYFESAENCTISRARALQELRNHHLNDQDDIADFYRDLGELDAYQAQDVLRWLGY